MTETERGFRARLERSDLAAELFFPPGAAAWHEDRYRIERNERAAVRTQISGVRFQAADPRGEDLAPERQCQRDVVALVDGVARLREVPGFDGLVVGPQTLRAGPRVKFGLERNSRYAEEPAAAGACHRRIKRAVRRAGLVVDHPRAFDEDGGLPALRDWAGELRLRRRRRIPLWPLLLLLLLLIPFLIDDAVDPERFFGVPIETSSIIVLVDKSNSMTPHFPVVQAEAKNLLQNMLGSSARHYANVIAYDNRSTSALDGLEEVTDETRDALMAFLDGLSSGGGTNLRAGLERAAAQVAAHEQPTTLVILTDGLDKSIRQMLREPLLEHFAGVEIVGNALTPRLFGGKGDPAPQNEAEEGLRDLATQLNGRFGPERGDT